LYVDSIYFLYRKIFLILISTNRVDMIGSVSINKDTLQQWAANKLDPQIIEQELKEKGLSAEEVAVQLKAYKKLRNANKQFVGFLCVAIGAFLGFISCVLSILNPIPELYNVILFGLTSIAIIIICVGMYFIFE
jgi:hypothetical protein